MATGPIGRSTSIAMGLAKLARAPMRNLFRNVCRAGMLLSGCAAVELEPELALASGEDAVEEIDVAELDAALARLIKDLEAAIEATRVADKNTKRSRPSRRRHLPR